jgi:hypothetical protein
MTERDEILVAAILRQAERSRAWLVDSIVLEPCGGKGASKAAAQAKRKRAKRKWVVSAHKSGGQATAVTYTGTLRGLWGTYTLDLQIVE